MLITKDLLQPGDISPPLNGELGIVMCWVVEVQGGIAGDGELGIVMRWVVEVRGGIAGVGALNIGISVAVAGREIDLGVENDDDSLGGDSFAVFALY
jgi:hypothetical protein